MPHSLTGATDSVEQGGDVGQRPGICQFYERDEGRFDPTNLGLDHFAFSVETRSALDGWAGRLDDLGIVHSGAIEVPPGAILNLKDPDDIALALMWRR